MSGIALADAVDQGPDLIRDLLILEARGATGQLEVISAGVHTLLYFVDGQLVYAEGGSQTDTLGRLLVRSGSLSREQYSAVLQGMTDAFVEHEEMRFGEVAIGLGYLTPQDVTEGLARQVRSRLLGCLEYEQSIRYFDEGDSYTGRVPRFPIELGSTLMLGLQRFYGEERLFPLLFLSLERRWKLRNPSDWGAARFAFSGEELQVARQLMEPARLADLIGDPPATTRMRVALLLWLAGLVEDCEPYRTETGRARSERPSIDRALVEDVHDRSVPSIRPPAPVPSVADDEYDEELETQEFDADEVEEQAVDTPSAKQADPAPPPADVDAPRGHAADLASARARVLRGLQGAGRPQPGGKPSAAAALAALRDRRKGSSQVMRATRSAGDPHVEADALFQRGRIDLEQGRTAAARQHFESAYHQAPTDEYALYLAWARFLGASGAEVANERSVLEARMMDCLRADRRMAFGHYVAGRLALIDENFEGAEKSFKRAASLDPTLTDAARSLRLVQQRMGQKKS